MPAEQGQGAATAAGAADLIGRRMSLGWVPVGLHTWRAADGAALFHRLRFVRSRRRAARAELDVCLESLHFDGRAWRGGEPAPPPAGRPVFMLPELLAADAALPVYVMPDETAAAMLFSLGLPATTCSGALPSGTDWSPLRGRRLRLWPVQGRAARCARRELLFDLRQLFHLVEELDCASPGWPSGVKAAQGLAAAVAARPWRGHGAAALPDLRSVRAGALESAAVRWPYLGYVALGKLRLLPGDAGLGKSLVTVSHPAKAGYGGSLLYRVSGAPRLHWETAPVVLDAKGAEAAAWLRELLAEGGLPAAQVRKAGLRVGLGWRRLQDARRAAGVFTICRGAGRGASTLWTLEPAESVVEGQYPELEVR